MAPHVATDRIGAGGGLAEGGEDIEVLELGYNAACTMVASGDLVDGKTIALPQHLELRAVRQPRAAA